jgi:hypothetical protein
VQAADATALELWAVAHRAETSTKTYKHTHHTHKHALSADGRAVGKDGGGEGAGVLGLGRGPRRGNGNDGLEHVAAPGLQIRRRRGGGTVSRGNTAASKVRP